MARRKRQKRKPIQARGEKAEQRQRRYDRRLWERLLVVAFTTITSLLLPLYFQHQSDSSQSQMMSQLATVEAQQHDLLTRVVSSPQPFSVGWISAPCIATSAIDFVDVGNGKSVSGPVTLTITNCGDASWRSAGSWLSVNGSSG